MAETSSKGGNRITRQLIRKRAEHNESIISTLEELSLHQEELVAIDEVLGTSCRKLKILYLQNNIIGKLENLHHMKDLEYLNVALNNIQKIEGLDRCEFLAKLDMTVNFVDLDELEDSISNLASRRHLRELYLMGNPAQSDWSGFNNFVIASLPQLESLDGVKITRSMRIIAQQQLPHLRLELRELAATKRAEKKAAPKQPVVPVNPEEATPYTPEVRTAIYEELAEQKAEAEARKAHLQPRERDAKKEQRVAVAEARLREQEGRIKQCNQGKWHFQFDDESKPGSLLLDVAIARHLDSSLIDLDIHPHYVSVVIKSKTLRLALPVEVKADKATAKRSTTTGHLLVDMPKVDDASDILLFPKQKKSSKGQMNTPTEVAGAKAVSGATTPNVGDPASNSDGASARCRVTRRKAQPGIANILLQDAAAAARSSSEHPAADESAVKAISTRLKSPGQGEDSEASTPPAVASSVP